MNRTILTAERIALCGIEDYLGALAVNHTSVIQDARDGRGLLIVECPDNRVIGHVCHAARNSLPLRSALIPLSHMLVEEIVVRLETHHGLRVWRTTRTIGSGIGDTKSSVWVTTPEDLGSLGKKMGADDNYPDIVHVLDWALPVAIPRFSMCGQSGHRASAIGFFKARCQVEGTTPYVVIWTSERRQHIPRRRLCQSVDVEAWLCVDGRTLRTAAWNPALSRQ